MEQDLRNVVHMLPQLVVVQCHGQDGLMTSNDGAARVASRQTQDFYKSYPPTFIGSDLNEDP